ncbi:DUF4817 domain-containing protein [Trichonephila clavipes]|uniref:DUF4817 domain-containing protein n=1 Tax=Trichonephila clavipes TaxID=2585209 RepID=A0A8X6VEP3_TRICX|nr:DUF4817 domain-containing protein [Trichonephila clavipes]
MVFLNEVLTEFLDDIPLAAIQRLWFQHDGAPAYFCAPVRDWLDIAYPGGPLDPTSCSMASTLARSYTVGFFPMEPSQGTGVSRCSDNTNRLNTSSVCCLYFGGPRSTATCDDSHFTACSSLPRQARRTL